MNRRLAASFALLLASSPVPCLAAPNGEATLVFRYDDLDLSTPQGVKAFRQRIERAADQVCVQAAGLEAGEQPDQACRADALATARAQLPHAIAEQRLNKSHALAEAAPR